ncbi:MAG: hypothetical protein EBU85_05545 [Actinobacteria bacterium]|nr:hypothetical protein [Actinomycetota bacterium]
MRQIMRSVIFVLAAFLLAACGQEQSNQQKTDKLATPRADTQFKLVVAGSSGHKCKVQLILFNRSSLMIDAMSFGVVSNIDYSRKTNYWRTAYIKPKGDSDFFYESLGSDCYDKCNIEIQEVEHCKLDGKIYGDCFEHLEVESRDSRCTVKKVSRQ